jgi:hypothetical protein
VKWIPFLYSEISVDLNTYQGLTAQITQATAQTSIVSSPALLLVSN